LLRDCEVQTYIEFSLPPMEDAAKDADLEATTAKLPITPHC